MAFLDNSGDIILDAVLTDTGRFRMARGDFRISKFALGDDEIDYSLYNPSHPSGSAYYDLEILRTPLLEAFTNNTSTMKSKLVTISRTNILHMPVMRLLNGGNPAANFGGGDLNEAETSLIKHSKVNSSTGGYIILVDQDTNALANGPDEKGILQNNDDDQPNRLANQPNSIVIERGLDTTEISPVVPMPATLQETQFIFEMDHRLGALCGIGGEQVPVSFIDDDQVASYYVSSNTAGLSRQEPLDRKRVDAADDNKKSAHNIRGPRDRVLHFKVIPNINLQTSTFLFEKLGTVISQTADNTPISGLKRSAAGGTQEYYMIDTSIRITSATTAYSIEVPIRYMKKK